MEEKQRAQNVLVMRHGDRIDHAEPLWPLHAPRPWDPPLTEAGKIRAWTTGKRLRGVGFSIHRVIVSPFVRCLQTAAEVVTALCSVIDDPAALLALETSHGAAIDPSRVKVSIEYGLSEMLNTQAIGVIPKDGKWFPDLLELEAVLPAGTIDHSVEHVYQEMPQWGESVMDARIRYEGIIQALADKYPHENLLLVTHGEGVGVSASSFQNDVEIYEVEYCAYSHLQRQISLIPTQPFTAENFIVLTKNGQTGVHYIITPESEGI
ncbi:uncharacterized protein [Typha angustifolia]|uniref:uncharacterized protein n=1 Tax=Typha angustifolia TaxID=59011 RepID=UPI003C2F8310